jgi:hypothetical protein
VFVREACREGLYSFVDVEKKTFEVSAVAIEGGNALSDVFEAKGGQWGRGRRLSSSGLKGFDVVSGLFWEAGEDVGVDWGCHGDDLVVCRTTFVGLAVDVLRHYQWVLGSNPG